MHTFTITPHPPQASSGKHPGIHFVITSNGSPYMNWQTRVLYQTFLKHKNEPSSGLHAFTRVLHRMTPDDLVFEVPTARFDTKHPDCDLWCSYPVADRSAALREWMETEDAKQCEHILLGETDYLLMKAIPPPSLQPGQGIGFPFGYIAPRNPALKQVLERLYPPELGPVSDIPATGNAPILMRSDDMKRVVAEWELVVAKMERDPEAVETLGWVREMYAFSIACAKARVSLDLTTVPDNTLMVQPPADRRTGEAAMMHYTWGTEMYTRSGPADKYEYTMIWTFDKRSYMKGEYHNTNFKLGRIPELPEWQPETYFLQEWFRHEPVKKDLMDILRLEASIFNEAVDIINAENNGLPKGFTTFEAAFQASEPGDVARATRVEVEKREREEREAKQRKQQEAQRRVQKPYGPPYALVQGGFSVPDMWPAGKSGPDLPNEPGPVVKRGHACMIGSGPDFFIAVADHPEWGNAFNVFGVVKEEDMRVVDEITRMPTVEQVWGETHVTALKDPLPFTLKLG
eukprot:jgi/Chlat1/4135/Chrsp269S03965